MQSSVRGALSFLSSLHLQPQTERQLLPGWIRNLIFALFGALIVYGIYLRSGDQATKDFWLDEVWRAAAIRNTASFFALSDPIHLSEFLLGKLGLSLFGDSEIAFRLWPLLFSSGALMLYAWISCQLFEAPLALISTFLCATSIGLVEHAHEIKMFSFESFMMLLCLAGILQLEKHQKLTGSTVLSVLIILAALTINLFPFLLFLFLLYTAKELDGKSWKEVPYWRWLLPLIPLALFALLFIPYYINLKQQGVIRFWNNSYLNSFESVKDFFVGRGPATVWQYLISSIDFRHIHFGWSTAIFASAWCIGPIVMIRRKSLLSCFVLFPLITMILLSICGVYPFPSRACTFFYPVTLLAFIYVLNAAWENVLRYNPKVFNSCAVVLLAGAVGFSVLNTSRAEHRGTRRHIQKATLLTEVLEQKGRRGDLLFLNYGAHYALQYYQLQNQDLFTSSTYHLSKSNTPASVRTWLKSARVGNSGRRMWIMSTHNQRGYEEFKSTLTEQGMSVRIEKVVPGGFLLGSRFPKTSDHESGS